MTTSEVPAAYSMGRLRATSRAGTTRKPPPTPRKPVSRPTAVAVTSTLSARGHWQAKVGLKVMIGSSSSAGAATVPAVPAPRPRHWRTASRVPTTSISTAKAPSSTASGTAAEARAPATAPPSGDEAEGDAAGEQDVARAVGRDRADQRGHPDHHQRPGGGLGGALPERVDQHRHRQDRAAATERAQAEPDERAGDEGHDQGADDHASGPTRWRPTCSALSKESSMATSRRPAASSIDAATEAR